MALWSLAAASEACAEPSVVVLSPVTEALRAHLPNGVSVAIQAEPRGTGDAVRAALGALPEGAREVLVVCGDTPLLTPQQVLALPHPPDYLIYQ